MRACAVETHVKISREPLYTENYRKKNAAAQSEHSDQAPAFTATVRYRKNPYEPLSMDILFGEKAPCRMSGLFGIDEYIPFPRLVQSEGVDFQQRD